MKANYFKRVAVALVIALVAVTGCKKEDWGDGSNPENGSTHGNSNKHSSFLFR